MSRLCQICGKSLEGKRADTKTCGPICRNALSAERKKSQLGVAPGQSKTQGLLEEKLDGIEQYLQGCRALMEGKSGRFRQGIILRSLFEIEEAARSVLPELDAKTSSKQRAEERWDLLKKAGWA